MNPQDKLSSLADQILRSLDALEEKEGAPDPHVAQVRGHVLALAQLLGAHPELVEERQTVPPPRQVRGFRPTTIPASPLAAHLAPSPATLEGKRPALYTERRMARLQSGVSLRQIKEQTGMSYATVRMYEVRPQSVRPDKRAELDTIYSSFGHKPTK